MIFSYLLIKVFYNLRDPPREAQHSGFFSIHFLSVGITEPAHQSTEITTFWARLEATFRVTVGFLDCKLLLLS